MRAGVAGARLLLLALVLLPLQGSAQSAPVGEVGLDPLRPPDTSSPRATLRDFLVNASQIVDARRRDEVDDEDFRAYRRAVQTIDLSTTHNGDSWLVRNLRVALLQEVLARVPLPPPDEIPGEIEVAEGLTRWTIPGTRITIRRIESGPRAGEFLFSAETIEEIDRYYRQVRHLPYQPGAIPGVYEKLLRGKGTGTAREREMRDRLKPVGTSSPRSTLEGFMERVNRAHALVREADAALKATPPTLTRREARAIELEAARLLERAVSTLDLSEVPEARRDDVGVESVLQLKEILDRGLLPPLESIPNAQAVAAARMRPGGSFQQAAGPLRWTLPNSEIEIAEIEEGERRGQFLFSARTVRNLGEYYERVEELSYRQRGFGGAEYEYRSPELSPGFYLDYISKPGYLVPRAHLLGGWVDDLPDSFKRLYGEQTLWQWIGLIASLVIVATAGMAVFRVGRRMASGHGPLLDHWLAILTPAVLSVLIVAAVRFADTQLNITGTVLTVVGTAGEALAILLTASIAFRVCTALAETGIASPRIADEGVDASLLRLAARISGFVIAVGIVVAGARSLGVDMLPLIAGLGVGGLAVALAAQRTLANFLGSLILFANRPVRVGDLCRYGDQIGTVEEIGLISTRIRSLERTLVTVPNAEFSEMQLDNYSARDQRLLRTVLNLRLETTPDQLRHVLAELRSMLLGHPMVSPDPARVRFLGMGAYSLDVEIFAYLRCQEQDEFLAIREDVMLRVVDVVKASGTGFAFPSQTTYLGRDSGLDLEQAGQAETRVGEWRSAGQLPFPDFDEATRQKQQDVLDYPPEGSAGYSPKRYRGDRHD